MSRPTDAMFHTTARPRPWLLPLLGLLPLLALALAGAAHAQVPVDPGAPDLARDRVLARVATLADPSQQYSLYLPPGSDPAPLLIILDARGRGERTARMAMAGARAHGWMVMSSWQSRSDTTEAVTLQALQALLDEAATRFGYDRKRLYLAGFSGTAKTLWTQVEALRGPLAGMIGCGGGRPAELGPLHAPPAFFGMAGTRDFNYQEMRDLDDALAEAGANHRLAIFDGGHGWPPDPAVFEEAIDWLELRAMADGRAPMRPEWVDARLAAARAAATHAPDPLARWRRTDQLVRDFAALRDVASERAAARGLASSAEVREGLETERRLRGDERRQARRFDAWREQAFARDLQGRPRDPPPVRQAFARLRIPQLQQQARGTGPAADSAARILERDFVATAFYLPRQLLARNDLPGATAMLAIASAIFPGRPQPHWQRARLLARQGRIGPAIEALETSHALGFVDIPSLLADPDWQALRDDARWPAVLQRLRSEPVDNPSAD